MAKGGGKSSAKTQAKAAPKSKAEPKTKRSPGDEKNEIIEELHERDIDIDAPVPLGAIVKGPTPAGDKKTIVEKVRKVVRKKGPDKVETEPSEAGDGGGPDGEGDDFPEKEEHNRDRRRDRPHPEKIVANSRSLPKNIYSELQHAHAAANMNSPSHMLATAAVLGRMGPQPQLVNPAPINPLPTITAPVFARRTPALNGHRAPIGRLRTITDAPRPAEMWPVPGRRPQGRAPLSARLAADLQLQAPMPGSTLDMDAEQQFGMKSQQNRQGAKFGAGPGGRAGATAAVDSAGSGAGGGPR